MVIAAVLASSNVLAGGYTGPAKINWMNALGNSAILTHASEMAGAWGNPDSCTSASKFLLGAHSSEDAVSIQSKHAMILAAYMADKTVEFYVDGCTSWGQPIIKDVYIPARNP